MKRRILAGILASCCMLSGCTITGNVDTSPTATTSDPPSVSASTPPGLDYSAHTAPDEERYQTVLTDPTLLKEGKPVFATQTPADDWSGMNFGGLARKDETWGYDVRSADLSKEDLSVVADFNDLSFNTDTLWPQALPEGFDPAQILEYNKNPGLGIRALHEEGITGAGVGIAIIDQGLLLDHEQYKDNLMYYEKIHCIDEAAAMHGPAVASIAVGKDIGVAPGAKLYYIAETHGHFSDGAYDFDASIIADSILRVLQINEQLPENEKIRVISISRGCNTSDKGYLELTRAIDTANAEQIFVITTNSFNFPLFGMNRDYGKDPDDIHSYLPAGWIAKDFYANPSRFQDDILVPMGSRTYAGCTGTSDYELSHEGGLSWAVPWCAGFYALCCQVKPDITPEEFIKVVKDTAVTTEITKDGKAYPFGKIINPAGVMEALGEKG